MKAYQDKSQSELEISDEKWGKLKQFLRNPEIQGLLKTAITKYDIEERPPTLTDDGVFKPFGWVGTYPGDIMVQPKKISAQEYGNLIDSLKGWLEILGPPTIDTVLPFSPDVLLDARVLYRSYSQKLSDFTEILLSHRVPREVNKITGKSPELKGKPLFREIAKLQSRGSQNLAYQSTQFSFRTLPNLLLTSFHAELAGKLKKIANENKYFREELKSQIAYHQEFINSGIPVDLLSQSLETNFFDSEVLEKARRISPPQMKEIIDLWEAYKEKRSMKLDVRKRFDTAIKPISKIYELWCLKILIEILEEHLQTTPKPPEKFPCIFEFGDEVRLYYNKSLPQSRFIKGEFEKQRSGRPDYAVEVDDRIAWIGDAKFKTKNHIGEKDYMRFLSYLVDYMPASESSPGSIFYISDGSKAERAEKEDYQVSHLPLRPANLEENKKVIYKLMERILSDYV